MEPVTPVAPTAPQPNDQLLTAINSLKTDLTKTIDEKLEAQKTEFEDKFKAVDSINETLEKARQNQIEEMKRRDAINNPKPTPQTWEEAEKVIEDRAAQIAEAKFKERDQASKAQAERVAREESQLEAEIDRSLQALEQSGYLPAVGNPNDYNDPGVAARRELLSAASHMGTPELDKVADTLTQLHRQNMVFDPQTKSYISADNSLTPLPGKYAPVGNSSTSSPSRFAGPTTRELRNSTMDDLVALAEQRGYGPVPTSVVEQPGGF